MTVAKLQTLLKDKPKFLITYSAASRDHRKQVLAILDKLSTSKSDIVKAAISDPSSMKWEIVVDRAPNPPKDSSDHEEVVRYFATKSRLYLKATAGAIGSGGRFIHLEPLDTVPTTILAQFEQAARLLVDRQDQAVEEDDEDQGVIPAFREPAETLLTTYDRWYAANPSADKRIYFIGRELVKHLIESTADRKRVNHA